MESYVREMGWSSYDQVEMVKRQLEPIFDKNNALSTEKSSRIKYLEGLLSKYMDYEPYICSTKKSVNSGDGIRSSIVKIIFLNRPIIIHTVRLSRI